jgi:hypothetical protein
MTFISCDQSFPNMFEVAASRRPPKWQKSISSFVVYHRDPDACTGPSFLGSLLLDDMIGKLRPSRKHAPDRNGSITAAFVTPTRDVAVRNEHFPEGHGPFGFHLARTRSSTTMWKGFRDAVFMEKMAALHWGHRLPC